MDLKTNASDPNTTLSSEGSNWQVIPGIINGILICITLWIIISLIYYGWRYGKWKNINQSNVEKLSHGLIYTSAVVCAVFCELRFVASQVELNMGLVSAATHTGCEVGGHLANFLYCMAFFTSFLMLWLRQRVFYSNKMLNVSYGRCINILSKYVIVVIFVAFGISMGIHVSLHPSYEEYTGTPGGCLHVNETVEHTISVVLLTITLVLGELILVALFVYPLRKRLRRTVMMGVSRRYRTLRKRSVINESREQRDSDKRASSTALSEITQTSVGVGDSSHRTHDDVFRADSASPSQSCRSEASSASRSNPGEVIKYRNQKQSAKKPSRNKRQSLRAEIQALLQRSIVALLLSIASIITITCVFYASVHIHNFARVWFVVYDFCVFAHFLYILSSFSFWREILVSPLQANCCKKFKCEKRAECPV